MRLRLVSRYYNSIITSPIFITRHFNLNQAKSLSNNHNVYVLSPKSDRPLDREICKVVCYSDRTLTEISSFLIPFPRVKVFGFCNGIFCLHNYCDDRIYLWNPSIKKYKRLAYTALTFKTVFPHFKHGLAYHSQNNDFKILRILCSYGTSMVLPQALVYTLSTDSWRRVVVPEGSLTQSIGLIPEIPIIFFNGALHCIANTTEDDSFILCFDVNDERFREILLPANDFRVKHKRLVVIKGSLALVCYGKDLNEESDKCCIWVMREYGVVESWTRSTIPVNFGRVFGSTTSDELLIETRDRWLVSLDPDSLNVNSLGIRSPRCLRYTTDFMESLVLVDGENQV